jgi:phage tail-like protein
MASVYSRNFKFIVTIAGYDGVNFQKVSGLSTSVEVIEYREGGDSVTTKKFPGQVSYENVTLERGLTTDSNLVDWINSVFSPNNAAADQRIDVNIKVKSKNQDRTEREFILQRAFCVSRQIADLDATGNDILIETLELAHEGIKEIKYTADGAER